MLSQLLRFEVFYQVKQKAFIIFAFIFLGYGIMAGRQGFAPAQVDFNAPFQINFYTGLISLGCVFIIMFLAVGSALRDSKHQMEHLIYSAPIKKAQFFFSRFMGLFFFSILSFAPFLIGYASAITFSNLDPERVASFEWLNYLQPFFFFVIPNVFFCSSLIFSVTILTRSSIATYVSAFFIYMLYMVSSIFLNSPIIAGSVPASPEAMAMAALADPFGLAAFFEQTEYWTAFEKNNRLLSFSGMFMWNRFLWTSLSLLILFVSYQLFSFRSLSKKNKKQVEVDEELPVETPYRPVTVHITADSQRKSFLSLLKLEWNSIFKSLPFLTVNVIWVVVVFMDCFARINGGGAYNDSWYPMTNLLIELFADPLMLFGFILIVFYSGELVWRERGLNFNGILDATPVNNWTLFVSKFLVLVSLPMMLILSSIVLAIVFQISHGYFTFETGQYLAMFYFNGMTFLIFSVVAMFLQSIVRNKYLGMGLTTLVIIFSFLSEQFGIEHLMLRLGNLSIPSYSNMIGYSGETLAFAHYSIYWVAFCGLLSLISFKLWQRGIQNSILLQLKTLFNQWKMWERWVLTFCLLVFVLVGSAIWYQTHVINEYFTSSDVLNYRERYERKFKKYESLSRLYHSDMKVAMDLFPEEKRYEVKADYVMINREDHAITQLFISEREPMSEITLQGAFLIESDEEFGTYLFEFAEPVKPGQKVAFSFRVKREFKGYETTNEIVKNGTYLMQKSFEPILTYRSGMEIKDNFERSKRGLSKRPTDMPTDSHLTQETYKVGKVNYETVISTSEGEVAIGTGNLLKEWKEEGRNYFHYKTSEPVMPTMAYFSSSYQILKDTIDGTKFEQYYFPKHDFNVDSISASVRLALSYCNDNFGKISFDQLRMAEVPSHWTMGGFAHPGVISMVEDNLYLIDIRDPMEFNLVTKRTIHEVAHQWWGHLLAPKAAPGASIFIEGFAKYTEAVVMEHKYGKRALFQLSQTARKRYFSGRAFASELEPPLYLVYGHGYLSYGKAYTVMLGLKELLGERQVNDVLKSLVDNYGGQEQFELTSLMLLEALYLVADEKQKLVIDDWFKRVITYDLSVENAEVEKLANGQYEVTIQLDTRRFETNTQGEEEQIGINESIVIGAFDEHPSMIQNEESILYLAPNTFNAEKSTVKITLDRLPHYVAIDPFGARVEEDFANNIVRL